MGLMLGVLLSALDQTVVGTSMPRVVADIGGFEYFAWIFSAYMLTSTLMIPIAGKFSDLYGRRPIYLLGMLVFLAGSFLCGTATDIFQLIIYRALQGAGGGMLMPVSMATVADVWAPAERGKVQGAIGAMFGLSSVIGPFLGGWIVDNLNILAIASWRWVFYVNLPVGIVAVTFILLYFPKIGKKTDVNIDYPGSAAMSISLVSLLLAMIWGGETFAWDSVQILGLFALSAASLCAFVFLEMKAKDPIIPPALFSDRIFVVSALCATFMGISMFGVISFLPTYMQGVVGFSATNSGAVLLPLTVMLVFASFTSGMLMAKYGYKIFTIIGTILASIELFLVSRLGTSPPIPLAIAEMMIIGVGLGFTMQTYVVATQNSVPRKLVGTATSTITLVRSIGATVGTTVLGSMMNRQFASELDSNLPPQMVSALLANPFIDGHKDRIPSLLLRPEFTSNAPAMLVEGIKLSFANALGSVFAIASCVAVCAFVTTLFLKSIPLKGKDEYHNGLDAPKPAQLECPKGDLSSKFDMHKHQPKHEIAVSSAKFAGSGNALSASAKSKPATAAAAAVTHDGVPAMGALASEKP